MNTQENWSHYFIYLFKWPLLAVLIGATTGLLVWVFNYSLNTVSLETNHWWLFGLPVLGGLITGLIGWWIPEVHGDGTQIYIDRVDRPSRRSFRLLFGKLAATVITLGTGGSGGRVGPVTLMGSVVGKLTTRLKIFPHPRDNRVTAVCGAAAGVGALFGTPLGGGIFAAEILFASSLDYNVLFPAILASICGSFMNHHLLGGTAPGGRVAYSLSLYHLPLVLAAIVLSAVVGMAFVYLYEELKLPFGVGKKIRWYLPALGGAGVTLAGLVFSKGVMGTGEGLVAVSISGELFLGGSLLLLIGKLFSTTMTVKAGGSGGLTFPAIILGCLAANATSRIFGVVDPGLHQAIIGAGIAASMASVLNTPIAATIIMMEIFGIQVAVPVILGAVLGFIIGRPKTIYSYRNTGIWKKSRGI